MISLHNEKNENKKVTLIPKSHTHFQNINTIFEQVLKKRSEKTVGDVTITKYPPIASEIPKNNKVHKLKK